MKTKKYKKYINLTKKNNINNKKKYKFKNVPKKNKKTRKKIIKKYKKTQKNINGGYNNLENICYNFPSSHNCRWCGSMCHVTQECCLN